MAFHEAFKNYCNGPFGFPMPEEDARELDKALEKAEEEILLLRRVTADSKSTAFVQGENADVSVITDDSVDEDGEIIDMKSINFDSFRKNPLVTFNHNYTNPPIGKSLWQKQVGSSIRAKTQYVPKPDTISKDAEWFPDTIFHMVKSGFLPGKSVGGISKARFPTDEEKKLNPATLKRVRFDTKIYEYSVVTRQANNNAIVEAVSKGLFTIPKEILSDFPEVLKIKKELEGDLPVIKEFRTLEDYNNIIKKEFETRVAELNNKTPEMVEDVFARLLGRV